MRKVVFKAVLLTNNVDKIADVALYCDLTMGPMCQPNELFPLFSFSVFACPMDPSRWLCLASQPTRSRPPLLPPARTPRPARIPRLTRTHRRPWPPSPRQPGSPPYKNAPPAMAPFSAGHLPYVPATVQGDLHLLCIAGVALSLKPIGAWKALQSPLSIMTSSIVPFR
jgi:hypothetical protein